MTTNLHAPEQVREQEIRDSIPPPDMHSGGIAWLHVLWRRRQFLFRTAGIGFAVSALLVFAIPKRYTSTARLMPPDEGPGAGMSLMTAALASKSSSSLGAFGSELLGMKTTGDLFIGILESRTAEDDLISKFTLRKVYGVSRWEDARKVLAARTSISEDRKSEIITIRVTDRSAQRAEQMAQEYITELDSLVVNLNTSAAHRERVFLEGQLGQVRQTLESAEKQFSQFASKNTAIDIQEQGKAMIEAGASLEGELMAAQTELEGLRQIYTDHNVRVREAQARIDELTKQLQKLGGKSGLATSSAVPDATSLYPPVRQLPLLGVTYADLYRTMKVQETAFEMLTQQYELAKVEEAKEIPSVKILDAADFPERKSFPPRTLIVFLSTLFAFSCAATWVLGRATWSATDDGDPRKIFVSQVWNDVRGSVPWLSQNGHVATINKKTL